jgi:tetratricopeptide (TPR) repeat protein
MKFSFVPSITLKIAIMTQMNLHSNQVEIKLQNLVQTKHLLAKAHSSLNWGFEKTALQLCNSYLLFNPNHLEAKLLKAYCLLKNDELKQAFQLFQKLYFFNPDSLPCLIGLAQFHLFNENHDEAEPLLMKALSLGKDAYAKSEVIELLAKMYKDSGDLQLALRTINEAIELLPFEHSSHYLHGIILMELGSFNEAKRSFDISIQLNKDSAEAFRKRANCWMMLNKIEYGLMDIKKAQKIELDRCKFLEAFE